MNKLRGRVIGSKWFLNEPSAILMTTLDSKWFLNEPSASLMTTLDSTNHDDEKAHGPDKVPTKILDRGSLPPTGTLSPILLRYGSLPSAKDVS
ncbi:hypothetical protein V6N13_080167 [Hibiscus sabdariffa]